MTAQPEDNDTPDMTPEERAEYLAAFYPDGDVIKLRSEIGQCEDALELHGAKLQIDAYSSVKTEKQDLEQQLKDLLSERKMHGLALVPETAPTPAPAAPVVAGSAPDLDHCPPTPQAEDEANGTFNEAPKPVPAAPPEAVLMPVIATPNVAESAPAVVGGASTESIPPRPVQRQHAQEQAIMHLIREAGHEPLRLPMNEPGKPGIKSHVRKLVMRDPIFTGSSVFDKAWERLRSSGEIADQH